MTYEQASEDFEEKLNNFGKTAEEYKGVLDELISTEEQRIKKAANMLLTTDYTLTKIAYECGFSSQSYFSYAFKRRMNVTPREYAKKVFNKYGN
jgi:AraC-like DNA-binding protein